MTKNSSQNSVANLTPRAIVEELNKNIVGQDDAKRAAAIAVRNRWRRQQLSEELQKEITPKNILMVGPTGVGKTEIARRLAKLCNAPFIKVEATKYTEVGYYGRDVESMIRELVENAIGIVRQQERVVVEQEAKERAEEKILDLLVPPTPHAYESMATTFEDTREEGQVSEVESNRRAREKMRGMLRAGELDHRVVELKTEQKVAPVMMGSMGGDQMDMDFQGMLEKFMPKTSVRRELTVKEAEKVLFEQECEALLDTDKINSKAIELAENTGIIFLDEIDKVSAADSKGADVSRQGVQRDLLPIVEGTTVQTKYGYIQTDHVLFIAAGAFHRSAPSDLMPELQGRFPIRVELFDLTKDDFIRILKEPKNSLTQQYRALIGTENITVEFTDEAVDLLAEFAFKVNRSTQNIGARRLHTIMERLLEELSFESPEMSLGTVTINEGYVRERLDEIADDEDLSRFIL
ncbi:MAG: ATP-dependent protease ATPase subunit HslU [Pirellulaceae bacterium]|nr:ATP-dependent protease ATPase subunit HslU [Pirellulaceae bacterium]